MIWLFTRWRNNSGASIGRYDITDKDKDENLIEYDTDDWRNWRWCHDDGDDENILEIRIEILWWVKFGITKAGILILLFWSTT